MAQRARSAIAACAARREFAIAQLRAACGELVRAGVATDAWLIGSAAWGGFGERSDVDVVVRALDPSRVTETADRLAAVAGVAVDLLRFEELAPSFRDRVERDGARLA